MLQLITEVQHVTQVERHTRKLILLTIQYKNLVHHGHMKEQNASIMNMCVDVPQDVLW